MSFIETTITEHVYNQGWIEGKGEARGEAKGKKETAINLLNMGVDVKITKQQASVKKKSNN